MQRSVFLRFMFFIGCFFVVITAYSQKKIIKTGDEWLYYNKINEPSKNWSTESNVNNNWKVGIAPLGYGDSIVKTEIGFGKDPKNKIITDYFKKSFDLEDPFKFILYKLSIIKDDGIVVYLNGREISRINMPDGKIIHNSFASGLIVKGEMEDRIHTVILSPEDFVIGKNTISASVHKAKASSIDCIFNIELEGNNDIELLPLLIKKTTIKNLQINARVNDLITRLEIDNKNLQIELTKQTKNNIKTYLFIVGALFFVLIVYLFIFWNNVRVKEKELIDSISKLKNQNNDKDRELMNTSINYYNNQQYLKELKKELERNVLLDAKSLKNSVEGLISKIDFNIDYSDSWDTLKYHFNAIHSGFIDRLTKMHPTLSDTEVRHCVFMKLHLQTKEIANILHIDARSVQASRYRIKKKMNLDGNTELKEYLQQL